MTAFAVFDELLRPDAACIQPATATEITIKRAQTTPLDRHIVATVFHLPDHIRQIKTPAIRNLYLVRKARNRLCNGRRFGSGRHHRRAGNFRLRRTGRHSRDRQGWRAGDHNFSLRHRGWYRFRAGLRWLDGFDPLASWRRRRSNQHRFSLRAQKNHHRFSRLDPFKRSPRIANFLLAQGTHRFPQFDFFVLGYPQPLLHQLRQEHTQMQKYRQPQKQAQQAMRRFHCAPSGTRKAACSAMA